MKRKRREGCSHTEDELNEDTGESDGESGTDSSEDDPLLTSDESDLHSRTGQEETSGEEVVSDESEPETQTEKDRKAAYFDLDSVPKEVHDSFLKMNLSRPIMKALTSLGFSKPTPIQASTIPVALIGKDIVGNAVTGSGKTAAFMVPMLERLMYREKGKNAAAIRCLILVPTRELGVQCYDVGTKLAIHTDIQFCLAVGKSPLQPFPLPIHTWL